MDARLRTASGRPACRFKASRPVIFFRDAELRGGPNRMAAKNKPYEQFGPYILFKKLESDALSELWRAAAIEGGQLGPLVAVRELTGRDRAALVAVAEAAHEIVPQLTGTSFAKQQVIDVISGTPFVAYEYSGGRSLRHLFDRA